MWRRNNQKVAKLGTSCEVVNELRSYVWEWELLNSAMRKNLIDATYKRFKKCVENDKKASKIFTKAYCRPFNNFFGFISFFFCNNILSLDLSHEHSICPVPWIGIFQRLGCRNWRKWSYWMKSSGWWAHFLRFQVSTCWLLLFSSSVGLFHEVWLNDWVWQPSLAMPRVRLEDRYLHQLHQVVLCRLQLDAIKQKPQSPEAGAIEEEPQSPEAVAIKEGPEFRGARRAPSELRQRRKLWSFVWLGRN